MANQNDGPVKTFIAGEAIEQFDCLKIHTDGTVKKTTGVASEDNGLVGIAQQPADSGAAVPVRIINCVASSVCRVTGAVAVGSKVFTMADGEVDDVSTSLTCVGVALETADAANEYIEVAHIVGTNDDIS